MPAWIYELLATTDGPCSSEDYKLQSREYGFKKYDFQFGISVGLIIWINS